MSIIQQRDSKELDTIYNLDRKNLFKNYHDLNKTEKQAKEILSLPINEFLKKKEVMYICQTIKAYFNEK